MAEAVVTGNATHLDAFVEKISEDLEKEFGNLYTNGSLKKVCGTESKTLEAVNEKLDALKIIIGNFQNDIVKASSSSRGQLEVPELRNARRETISDRDSGISSDLRLSSSSKYSEQSANRLSENIKDLECVTSEAKLYNPSPSGSNSSISDDDQINIARPNFYIDEIDQLSSSSECNKKRTDAIEQSKDMSCGEISRDKNAPMLAKVRNERVTHATDSFMAEAGGNTIPKMIIGNEENNSPVNINDLSKHSSEEDNTKYADNAES